MTAFADSSALVKLYVDEEGCSTVRALDDVVVAQVARVEVPTALHRHRTGELSRRDADTLVTASEDDHLGVEGGPRRFSIVATSSRVLDEAARLAGVHGLRAYDAVQLASALALAGLDPSSRAFVAFDRHLLAAAAAEGLSTSP